MRLKSIECENFRSFGKEARIDFDENITFFVGRNHAGKSNLFKFLRELKENGVPLNRAYKVRLSNWFNNESGVDRPLKMKFQLSLTMDEYQSICEQLLLLPMQSSIEDLPSPLDFSYTNWKNSLNEYFPLKECKLRLEFIQYADGSQLMNYSLQFNELIAICTADNRQFIDYTKKGKDKSHTREKETWVSFLFSIFEAHNMQESQELPPKSRIQVQAYQREILHNILQGSEKYIFSSSSIDAFFQKFFNHLILIRGTTINEPKVVEISRDLASILLEFQRQSGESPDHTATWRNYLRLQQVFEDIYDSLDLTFGIISDNKGPYIQYFERKTNKVLQNFDSIGTGINAMLNLLFHLLMDRDHIFLFEDPEIQLHPHSQRTLYNIIKEFCPQNQCVLITHSLFMFQPDDVFQLRIFSHINGITHVYRLEVPKNPKDILRLKRNFSIQNRDAIFADGIVFVEGLTEEMTFGYFFRVAGFDMDLNNLSLINIGGKGSFAVFYNFARQFNKKYWFFFDNDVMGLGADQSITPDLFARSVIYKNRDLLSRDVIDVCDEIVQNRREATIDFESRLELLRNLLQKEHIFVLNEDFETIFEKSLGSHIQLTGGKVDKAMQLVEFLRDNEAGQFLPESLYEYIEIIQEELKQ